MVLGLSVGCYDYSCSRRVQLPGRNFKFYALPQITEIALWGQLVLCIRLVANDSFFISGPCAVVRAHS